MLLVTNPKNKRDENALIGKALEKEAPEIYQRLKSLYLNANQEEIELKNIPAYYLIYCNLFQVSMNGKSKPEQRRLFIAAMIHIYCHDCFDNEKQKRFKYVKYRSYKHGFCRMLANTMGIGERMVNYLTGQSIIWYRIDEDFKAKVLNVVHELTHVDEA